MIGVFGSPAAERARGVLLEAGVPENRIALSATLTDDGIGAEAPGQWAERGSRAATAGMGALVEFQTTRWFGDEFRARQPQIVQHSVDVFLRNDVPAYVETCTMLGAADLRAALPGMTMPAANMRNGARPIARRIDIKPRGTSRHLHAYIYQSPSA